MSFLKGTLKGFYPLDSKKVQITSFRNYCSEIAFLIRFITSSISDSLAA